MRRNVRQRLVKVGAPVPGLRNDHEIVIGAGLERVKGAFADEHLRVRRELPLELQLLDKPRPVGRAKERLLQVLQHAGRRVERVQTRQAAVRMRTFEQQTRRDAGARADLGDTQRAPGLGGR